MENRMILKNDLLAKHKYTLKCGTRPNTESKFLKANKHVSKFKKPHKKQGKIN
jgi:hypothetical protein